MNLPFFIAKRLRDTSGNENRVSPRIIKIATTAVALGMAMIIIALATGKGLQTAIRDKTAAFNGHLTLMPFENNEAKVSLKSITLEEDTKEKILRTSGIHQLQGVAYMGGMLKKEETFEGVVFKGVEVDYDWSRLDDFLVVGDYTSLDRDEVVLSQTLAQRLTLKLGDEVMGYFQNSAEQRIPNTRKFRVAAIYNSGFPDVDNTLILGAIDQVQSIKKWSPDRVGNYELFLTDFDKQTAIGDEIYSQLPSAIDVVSLNDQYPSIFQWITLFDYNVLIILLVMVIVGVINMATALLVLIFERSRMIGVLKTIGATDRFLQTVFLSNGGLILLKGLFWGNLLGLLFFVSQRYGQWITLDPATYFVSVAPVHLDIFTVVGLNILVLVVSLLCLWVPLWVVVKIQPHQVIRFR